MLTGVASLTLSETVVKSSTPAHLAPELRAEPDQRSAGRARLQQGEVDRTHDGCEDVY